MPKIIITKFKQKSRKLSFSNKQVLFLLIAFIVAIILIFANINTASKSQTTFPKGVKIHKTNVSGMTAIEAKDALDNWAKDYLLTLTVNSQKHTYSALDLGISFSDIDIEKMLKEAKKYKKFKVENPIVYDEEAVKKAIYSFPGAYAKAQNAKIIFDASENAFVISKEESGYRIDLTKAYDSVCEAITNRTSNISLSAEKAEIKPSVLSNDKALSEALIKANELLDTDLTYIFTPFGKDATKEELSKEQLSKFIVIDDKFNVTLSDYQINLYCEEMSKKYSINEGYTSEVYLGHVVASGGHVIDTEVLKNSIKRDLLNKISGTFDAPYFSNGKMDVSSDYSYIEINITAQHMWYYENGECIVSTDIVTGNPYNSYNSTPTGEYLVTSKHKGAYLSGRDFGFYVDYWMGFSDPYYGIHDSHWRKDGEYGANIYKTNGSHGCVNTPLDAMAEIYERADFLTPVIVYK